MLSWAQRTARWTVKTLPFSFSRPGGGTAVDADVAGNASQEEESAQCPPPAVDQGPRRRPLHERAGGPPVRGRHAAPSRSRRARTPDTE
jgi:hypothetical protein